MHVLEAVLRLVMFFQWIGNDSLFMKLENMANRDINHQSLNAMGQFIDRYRVYCPSEYGSF